MSLAASIINESNSDRPDSSDQSAITSNGTPRIATESVVNVAENVGYGPLTKSLGVLCLFANASFADTVTMLRPGKKLEKRLRSTNGTVWVSKASFASSFAFGSLVLIRVEPVASPTKCVTATFLTARHIIMHSNTPPSSIKISQSRVVVQSHPSPTIRFADGAAFVACGPHAKRLVGEGGHICLPTQDSIDLALIVCTMSRSDAEFAGKLPTPVSLVGSSGGCANTAANLDRENPYADSCSLRAVLAHPGSLTEDAILQYRLSDKEDAAVKRNFAAMISCDDSMRDQLERRLQQIERQALFAPLASSQRTDPLVVRVRDEWVGAMNQIFGEFQALVASVVATTRADARNVALDRWLHDATTTPGMSGGGVYEFCTKSNQQGKCRKCSKACVRIIGVHVEYAGHGSNCFVGLGSDFGKFVVALVAQSN